MACSTEEHERRCVAKRGQRRLSARNIAPEVFSINVLPTNVGLAANPAVQVDPNIETSGLDPSAFGVAVAADRRRGGSINAGSIIVQWTAEDRNGDKMVYDVYYKEDRRLTFKLLKDDIDEIFHDRRAVACRRSLYVQGRRQRHA